MSCVSGLAVALATAYGEDRCLGAASIDGAGERGDRVRRRICGSHGGRGGVFTLV